MSYLFLPVSILEVLIVIVPVLLAVAFVTVAERKTMASMQRRVGPNIVGYYGLLQAFADALKLILKEYVSPTQANIILFFIGPIITLIFSLLGYAIVPYGPGAALFDFDLGILYMLAVSSIATYGILLAGWSANSKYAFLGSLRSTAQLISYELILTSAILIVILLTSSLNITINVEAQKIVWFLFPLFPLSLIFLIASVAETNRAPFDLAEAESELVSGFMTEHSAVIFVFFFLAEYASLVLMCVVVSILFIGGYFFDSSQIIDWFNELFYILTYMLSTTVKYFDDSFSDNYIYNEIYNLLYDEINYSFLQHVNIDLNYYLDKYKSGVSVIPLSFYFAIVLGIKTLIMVFVFIWVRASFPRVRFDQLMFFCWTILLPLVFAFIIAVPGVMLTWDIVPASVLWS